MCKTSTVELAIVGSSSVAAVTDYWPAACGGSSVVGKDSRKGRLIGIPLRSSAMAGNDIDSCRRLAGRIAAPEPARSRLLGVSGRQRTLGIVGVARWRLGHGGAAVLSCRFEHSRCEKKRRLLALGGIPISAVLGKKWPVNCRCGPRRRAWRCNSFHAPRHLCES